MPDADPQQVAIEPPRRHRWLRREMWFVAVAILLIAVSYLALRRRPSTHVAPGAPYGAIPASTPPTVTTRTTVPTR